MADPTLWTAAVYQTVQTIPRGKVTTYGHVAALLGEPQRPRQVGTSLRYLPAAPGTDSGIDEQGDGQREAGEGEPFHSANVPWQRVINAKGMISHRQPGAAARQAEVLRDEGVRVEMDALGEFYVDLAVFGWFPDPDWDIEGDADTAAEAEAEAEA